MSADHADRTALLAHRGMRKITPEEGSVILEHLLEADVTQIGVVPLDARQWVELHPRTASSPRLSQIVKESAGAKRAQGPDAALLEALRAAGEAERLLLLEQLVLRQTAEVLQGDASGIEREIPFKDLGVDSLMGIELRNRLESALGLTLSAALVWTYPSVKHVAAHLAGRLQALPSAGPESPAAAEAREDQAALEALQGLSEEDKAALLADKLSQLEDLL